MFNSRLLAIAGVYCLISPGLAQAAHLHGAGGQNQVWMLLKNGQSISGTISTTVLHVESAGDRSVRVTDLLTFQSGDAATQHEAEQIATGLAAIAGEDRKARDSAEAELTDIGLPVMTPLLATYKDTDLHEPNPLYRMFGRIIPGYADRLDRSLDLFRLANGDYIRGKLTTSSFKVTTGEGNASKETMVSTDTIRRIAVQRKTIDKVFDLQALRYCTPIGFLDAGIGVTSTTQMEEKSDGLARLSFNVDGWTTDPDGQKTPGPGHASIIEEGFPFGTLLGRVGPVGARWTAGTHLSKMFSENGRLYFAINDNNHWQNNIGGYRVKVHVTNAYDLGDPQ